VLIHGWSCLRLEGILVPLSFWLFVLDLPFQLTPQVSWIKKGKGKGKAEHLYSALHGIQTTLKRSGMDHTVLPAINTMPAFTS